MKRVETKIISGAMYELARTIQCDDGVANVACNEAALRLDEQAVEILSLKDKLRFLKPFIEYSKEQIDVPDGFSKLVNENFWDLNGK